MKKVIFFILFFTYNFLSADSLKFKGYPTKIQINDNYSYYLMINNDYDFSFYLISINNDNLEYRELTNYTNKDISDDSYNNYHVYKHLAEEDEDLQIIIKDKLDKEESKLERNSSVRIPFYVTCNFYKKQNGNTYCIFNFEDGNFIYPSQILYLENSKLKLKKLSKENIIYFSDYEDNHFICFKYNFKKDVTTVFLLDDFKKIK